MDLCNVYTTPRSEKQMITALNYITFILGNSTAAKAVYEDISKTKDTLKYVAGTLQLCEDKYLAENGYRKIKLQKHNYVFLYTIDGNNVYLEAFFHTTQDYENIFKNTI